jgi:hypothetical protein
MTGKRYYITTLGAWRSPVPRFVHSHFILLDKPEAAAAAPGAGEGAVTVPNSANKEGNGDSGEAPSDATPILVLIEADEGAHLALEDEAAFEALPHPLSQKGVSETAQAALAVHGVMPGTTTFDAAEALGGIHPLLRHRVF